MQATDAINRMWIRSKSHPGTFLLSDRNTLNSALERLLPNEHQPDNRTEPLNLIMPAYETMWRVVILTFVSVASRNRDPRTAEELREAVKNVPQCFCQGNDAETRALAIAKEGLRLYPPTKHIHRARSIADNDTSVIVADVEACSRDYRVWGADALEFKPARFHDWPREDTLKKLSYFPFGVGRHVCPASAGFAPRMITLLVVELTRRFGTWQTGLRIRLGDVEVQPQVPSLLPSGRIDMENWVLDMDID
ncbi:hypothetical protein NUW58_g6534 [Xylaria curta]|uniref:Uncharacterized protein n=1 Tax=Xylaria curta TaxID=42375 RepID=A0ACC1NTZ7_9PEZI|nr:hypothetical protein NUW58_g6534 [Xylaria curta]